MGRHEHFKGTLNSNSTYEEIKPYLDAITAAVEMAISEINKLNAKNGIVVVDRDVGSLLASILAVCVSSFLGKLPAN
jgi:tetrahydromethanopterin S-methyltransferase subunit G